MNQKNENQQTNLKKFPIIWTVIITIVITALIIGGGIYWWQKSVSEKERAQAIEGVKQELEVQINQQRKQIQDLEKEINDLTIKEEPKKQDEKKDETADWRTYENTATGFSLKYPSYVTLGGLNSSANLVLNITATKINSLINPGGYDRATALKDKSRLEKGEFGETIDWPGPGNPGKVVKINNIYAKDFMVLARFDVCDITFERKLLFYHNDYQVIITLLGNQKNIISSALEYFRVDKDECGDNKIWNFDKKEQFYWALVNQNTSTVAQNWYNTFDDIVKTIEIR